jgi:hypothetical protein
MKTTKSTLKVAGMALRAARDCLPDHAKAKSPKKFTQPQLVACLVIKEFRQLDYRGIHVLLKEWSDLREVLGLTRVPHLTTLCAAAQRVLRKAQADVPLIDEATIPQENLWPTLAGRNRLQHAQAKPRCGLASENLSQSEPRNPSARPDSQPRHPLASPCMFYTEQDSP